MNFRKYYKELKRRNVIKSGLAYLVMGWIVLQVISIVFPILNIPKSFSKVILVILLIGLPIWLIFSWIYELTPEGLKKTENVSSSESVATETSHKFSKLLIGAIFIAIILLGANLYFGFSKNEVGAQSEQKLLAQNTAPDKSIAVLAFDDMSQKKDQEYFSDGISEEILNLLAKIPGLKVISRTSSFYFKGKEATIHEIGNKLKVSHILEGSVRKAGENLRITAELVNVSDGSQIWSETFDRKLDDIFKIQDEIANKVTSELKANLLGKELHSKKTDPKAYNLYLEAKQLFLQLSTQSVDNAEDIIRRSIAIDSSYAPAWVLLSKTLYSKTYNFYVIPRDKGSLEGLATAKKAIQIDPDYAEAYGILAKQQMAVWGAMPTADDNVNKALALAPDNSEVIANAALYQAYIGRTEKSIDLYSKSLELDPLNYISTINLGISYFENAQFSKAEEMIRKYILHNPNSGIAHAMLSFVFLQQGKNDEALAIAEEEPDLLWKLNAKSEVLFALGEKQKADALLEEIIKKYGNKATSNIANIYAFRNEKDKAFAWLEKSYQLKTPDIFDLLSYLSMKNLWGDPRWNAFIKKLPLPKDHGFHLD